MTEMKEPLSTARGNWRATNGLGTDATRLAEEILETGTSAEYDAPLRPGEAAAREQKRNA